MKLLHIAKGLRYVKRKELSLNEYSFVTQLTKTFN